MKNQSTKLATELFHDTNPVVENLLHEVLVKHALDRKTTHAVTYLMELVQIYRNGCPKTRLRKFRPIWVEVLKNMLDVGAYRDFVHRSHFMASAANNDFSVMKHWGLITPGEQKGYWKLSGRGLLFLNGNCSIPDAMLQLGVKDGHYKEYAGATYKFAHEFLDQL